MNEKRTLTLIKLSLVGGTVTEQSDANILLLLVLHRESYSRAEWLLCTHNTITAIEILTVHMHRSTLAVHIARYTTLNNVAVFVRLKMLQLTALAMYKTNVDGL